MMHLNTFFFLTCFLSKELRYIAVLISFIYHSPPMWFSCFLLTHFYSGTSSTVNFTVELSEVLSVVIVIVFSYEYFNLHILGLHAAQYWLKPHKFFFLLFCLLERFLYSVHEYSDNIYSLERAHLHLGKCLLFHG